MENGKKISDSATLMNKILEIIEAQKLFSIPNKKLDIIILLSLLFMQLLSLKMDYQNLFIINLMIIPLANAIFETNLKLKIFTISIINKKAYKI